MADETTYRNPTVDDESELGTKLRTWRSHSAFFAALGFAVLWGGGAGSIWPIFGGDLRVWPLAVAFVVVWIFVGGHLAGIAFAERLELFENGLRICRYSKGLSVRTVLFRDVQSAYMRKDAHGAEALIIVDGTGEHRFGSRWVGHREAYDAIVTRLRSLGKWVDGAA